MPDELITPDNLSKELMYEILDAAYMEPKYDEDGDLQVKDRCTCIVMPSDAKDRIRLLTVFGFKPETPREARLEFVNKVNSDYALVRAAVGASDDTLYFDYYIPTAGGITKKAFVLALKRFCAIPHEAVKDYGSEIVE
jgi:hypothetical protein